MAFMLVSYAVHDISEILLRSLNDTLWELTVVHRTGRDRQQQATFCAVRYRFVFPLVKDLVLWRPCENRLPAS